MSLTNFGLSGAVLDATNNGLTLVDAPNVWFPGGPLHDGTDVLTSTFSYPANVPILDIRWYEIADVFPPAIISSHGWWHLETRSV